jgi:hypothetical protein
MKEKGDFTADYRLIWISSLALLVGALCAVVALVLQRLIAFFTALFYAAVLRGCRPAGVRQVATNRTTLSRLPRPLAEPRRSRKIDPSGGEWHTRAMDGGATLEAVR